VSLRILCFDIPFLRLLYIHEVNGKGGMVTSSPILKIAFLVVTHPHFEQNSRYCDCVKKVAKDLVVS
jgi:hypothetical protein